ncbi:MAG: acyl-CoA reductase [Chitinophagaceae bacterium]
MDVQQRIDLLIRLGQYMKSDDCKWRQVKFNAGQANGWFTGTFIEKACDSITDQFLNREKLSVFARRYALPPENRNPKNIGLVMAGNIPLVGFHDWMCIFITGHNAVIKASSKDEILITHLLQMLKEWEPQLGNQILFAPMLKGCEAYIATGSNNSGRYFEYYFSKYPHIIRSNRTSVAILTGTESTEALDKLADDVHVYFGLGCRNVTKIYVPKGYGFVDLLKAFKKYAYFSDHHKYKNNYDYQLAIHLLNNNYYMTNGSVLLIENASFFSPISQLNFEFYTNQHLVKASLVSKDIQCVVGDDYIPFGQAQSPALTDYADGTDTMDFLSRLNNK